MLEVLADVVEVALHCANDDSAHVRVLTLGHLWAQDVEAGLYDSCREQHLGDETLALMDALSDHPMPGRSADSKTSRGETPEVNSARDNIVATSSSPTMMACLSWSFMTGSPSASPSRHGSAS
jgi:hypothetical protein